MYVSRKPALCETLTINLTIEEKQALKDMAYEDGATLSGLLRRLIREEARRRNAKEAK